MGMMDCWNVRITVQTVIKPFRNVYKKLKKRVFKKPQCVVDVTLMSFHLECVAYFRPKNDASTDGVEVDIYGGDDEDDDDNGYVDDIIFKSMKAFGLPPAIIVGC